MDLEDVRGQVEIMQACKQRINTLQETYDQARAAVEEKLGDCEHGELDGNVVLTWRTTKQRRLNQAYLKQHYAGIREICMETTEVRRMELK
jgi:hypothetical protein